MTKYLTHIQNVQIPSQNNKYVIGQMFSILLSRVIRFDGIFTCITVLRSLQQRILKSQKVLSVHW